MGIPIYTYVTVNSELTQNKLQSNIYQQPSMLRTLFQTYRFKDGNNVYKPRPADKSPLRSDHKSNAGWLCTERRGDFFRLAANLSMYAAAMNLNTDK